MVLTLHKKFSKGFVVFLQFIGKERLELSILSALDFESSVYANSTTYRKMWVYSFFTSRSSFNDNFRRNYQTHSQPFLDDFHVGKTTHQACFVLVLKGVEPSFSDRKSDVLPLHHRTIKTVDGIWTHKLLNKTFSVLPLNYHCSFYMN